MDLPCVEWGEHSISRLLIGHNPIKGQSHYSAEMDAELKAWYAPESGQDLAILENGDMKMGTGPVFMP